MARMGRPTKYTEKIADEICRWLMEGGSLNMWCQGATRPRTGPIKTGDFDATLDEFEEQTTQWSKPEDRVARWTVGRWLLDREEFRAKYRDARDQQAETFIDLAADELHSAEDSVSVARAGHLARHYQWAAEKLAPRKYGRKVEFGAGEGSGSMTIKWDSGGEE